MTTKAQQTPIIHSRTSTAALGIPEIQATANEVTVCGTTIPRPPGIAPSQWLSFWGRVVQ